MPLCVSYTDNYTVLYRQLLKCSQMQTSSYLFEHALVEQGLFLGGHHKVVCLVLVVDDVLEVYARVCVEVLEELLVKDVCDPADLLHTALGLSVPVDKVGCDRDRELAAKLFPLEAWKEKIFQLKRV